ncbi:MAG: hypothetical protein ACT4OS_06985 [Acidimicrobiales bacterium]
MSKNHVRKFSVPIIVSALVASWAAIATPVSAVGDCDVEGTKGDDIMAVIDAENNAVTADQTEAKTFAGLVVAVVKGAVDICSGKGNDVVILDGLLELAPSETADGSQEHNLVIPNGAYDHDGVATVDLGKGDDVICADQGSDEHIKGGKGTDGASIDEGDEIYKVEFAAESADCLEAALAILGIVAPTTTSTLPPFTFPSSTV